MPFQSEAQRKYMFARHPEIAKRWVKEAKAAGKSPTVPNAPKKKKKGTVHMSGEFQRLAHEALKTRNKR